MLVFPLYTSFFEVFVEFCLFSYWIVFYLSIFQLFLNTFYSQLPLFLLYFILVRISRHIILFLRWLSLKNHFKTNTVNGVT